MTITRGFYSGNKTQPLNERRVTYKSVEIALEDHQVNCDVENLHTIIPVKVARPTDENFTERTDLTIDTWI